MARGVFGFSGAGTPSKDGRSLLWLRMPAVHHDAGARSLIADHMPSSLSHALGQQVGCTSLDTPLDWQMRQIVSGSCETIELSLSGTALPKVPSIGGVKMDDSWRLLANR